MIAATHEITYHLDDRLLTVGYTIGPYDPGRVSGPPENCYPPEGGEAEIQYIYDEEGEEVALSAEEEDRLRYSIEATHDHDGDASGPDPDEAYDRGRDGW